jgi:hypothetical protein
MTNVMKKIASFLMIMVAVLSIVFADLVVGNAAIAKAAVTTDAYLKTINAKVGIQSKTAKIEIEKKNKNATYTYSTANDKIATVDEKGAVTGVSKGKTTITVYEYYIGVTKELGKVSVEVVGPKLAKKEITVGINCKEDTAIDYKNNKAKYTYKSADTSIATVDKNGKVTGLKVGNTKITVTESYKNKTTNLGTYTVNVVNSKINKKDVNVAVRGNINVDQVIKYYNPKASYKLTTSNKSIAEVDKNGNIKGVKVGETTINIVETYKKTTRKLGKVTVHVKNAAIDPKFDHAEIGVNLPNVLTEVIPIQYLNKDAVYTCTTDNDSIIKCDYMPDLNGILRFMIKGTAIGRATITIYEEYDGKKTEVGKVLVYVNMYPITELSFKLDKFDDAERLQKIYYLATDKSDYIWDYLIIAPEKNTTPFVFDSNNKEVVTIDEKGRIEPKGTGTAQIIVTCGSFRLIMNVIVK